METLKNTLKNLILNSSNTSQIISLYYGLVRIWVEDLLDESTLKISKELRMEGFENFNEIGKIEVLKKAISTLS